MKRLFTLISFALASLCAFAQQEEVVSSADIPEESVEISQKESVLQQKPNPKKEIFISHARGIKKTASAGSVAGTYITAFTTYSSSYEHYSTTITTITDNGDGTYNIIGLPGQSDEYPVKATYNEPFLTIEKGQQINTSSKYGKVTLGIITDEGNFSKDDDIVLWVMNGSMWFSDGEGFARGVPEYGSGNTYLTPTYLGPELCLPNGTMTSQIAKSSTDTSVGEERNNPSFLSITSDGYCTAYAFDESYVCDLYLKPDGTVTIPADQNLTYSSTDSNYALPFKAEISDEGKFVYYPNTNPIGTYNKDCINLGPWGLYIETTTPGTYSLLNGCRLNSTITVDGGLYGYTNLTKDYPDDYNYEDPMANDLLYMYGTFSHSLPVKFTDEEAIKVYTVTVADGALTLNEIESKEVPANTGVLIKGDENSHTTPYYKFIETATPITSDNMLKPSSQAMTGDYKFYKLAYNDFSSKTGLGFYYGADEGAAFTAKEGGAYLAVPKSVASNAKFRFDFDVVTGIKNVNTSAKATAPTKRIVNGQLIIEKNGRRYNASGTQIK